MITKIQINSTFEKLLFEFEKEDNSIKATLLEALKQKADLRYADLCGANLCYADLRYANLRGADLRGANSNKRYIREYTINEKPQYNI